MLKIKLVLLALVASVLPMSAKGFKQVSELAMPTIYNSSNNYSMVAAGSAANQFYLLPHQSNGTLSQATLATATAYNNYTRTFQTADNYDYFWLFPGTGDNEGKYAVRFNNYNSNRWLSGVNADGTFKLVTASTGTTVSSSAVYVSFEFARDCGQGQMYYNGQVLRFDKDLMKFKFVDPDNLGTTIPAYLYLQSNNYTASGTSRTLNFSANSTSTTSKITNATLSTEDAAGKKFYLNKNQGNAYLRIYPQSVPSEDAFEIVSGATPGTAQNPYIEFKAGAPEGKYVFDGVLLYYNNSTEYANPVTLTVTISDEPVKLQWRVNYVPVTDPSKTYDYTFTVNSSSKYARNRITIYDTSTNTDVTQFFSLAPGEGTDKFGPSSYVVTVSRYSDAYKYITFNTCRASATLVVNWTMSSTSPYAKVDLPALTINVTAANPFAGVFSSKVPAEWSEGLSIVSSNINYMSAQGATATNPDSYYNTDLLTFTLEPVDFTAAGSTATLNTVSTNMRNISVSPAAPGSYNLVCKSTQYGVIPTYTIPMQFYPAVSDDVKVFVTIKDPSGEKFDTFELGSDEVVHGGNYLPIDLQYATLSVEGADASMQIWYKVEKATEAAKSPARAAAASDGYTLYDGKVDLFKAENLSVRLGQNGAVSPDFTTTMAFDSQQTGVGSITVDTPAGATEYFDLNGRRVDADRLTPGLYIERCGKNVRKHIVR